MQQFSRDRKQLMKAYIIIAAVAALLVTAATAQCPGDWTLRTDSCYKWFPNSHYWYDAEQVCRYNQGHLVSIGSENENTLAARLAQCRDVWLGRFGTKLNQLTDPRSYEWTDGSDAVSFHRHNFSRLDTVHKPLIRSDGEWWLNSFYHERHPFVCEQRANATSSRCPNGWTLFNNQCYLMPEFEFNFNEANFYCQRKSSQLVSVLSESELRLINNLTFGIGACRNPLDTVWIGLIKLNPCFPDSGGRELCYQWTDFSGKHQDFPKWHTGHPNKDDWTVNCVTLTGDGLRSDRCYNRHRFVCKSPAGNDTDGGGGSVDGVVAAFDFRKGLENLVNPRTYVVRDDFGVPRTKADGACFKFSGVNYYSIGQPLDYDESLLGHSEWTIFVRNRVDRNVTNDLFDFLALRGQPSGESEILIHQYVTQSYTHLHSFHFEYPETQDNATIYHVNEHNMPGANCSGNWCDLAISINNSSRAKFHFNAKSADAYHVEYYSTIKDLPEKLSMQLGNLDYLFVPQSRYCVSCFGIAHKQLSSQELQKAFSAYCP